MFTGNRGVLHNDRQELLTQRWRHKAWIVCVLQYKDWRRQLMTPRRWTELFFLDEATAFAAGHRPCGFCRREDYRNFLRLSGFQSAKLLDEALHAQRTVAHPLVAWETLLAGAIFAQGPTAFLRTSGGARAWTHVGYAAQTRPQAGELVRPLTAPLFCKVIEDGYLPTIHASALLG